jgi:uncharacterized heparinase superfamily protein
VNWIKWALAGHRLPEEVVHSLAVQVRYLRRCLEYRLLGNHLLANAKTLAFAGLFFAGEEARGWLAKGLHLMDTELRDQILADGGHAERSPMYHSLILEDLLDLVNLAQTYPRGLPPREAALPQQWTATIQHMRGWLTVMCHPDGQIGLFNDAAWDSAPSPADLDAYAQRLGLGPVPPPAEGLTHLPASGYVRLQRGSAVALVDVAELGADHLVGHAHADTLTFELSLDGARVIVNTGTSTYAPGAERQWQRSTAAHNTVEIDGQDSSEMWGVFRVARRARPLDVGVREEPGGGLQVWAAHSGYRRFSKPVLHRRHWRLLEDRLEIQDRVEGPFTVAVARFHVHPRLIPREPTAASPTEIQFEAPARRLTCTVHGATWALQPSRFHPCFGVALPTVCLQATLQHPTACYHFSWL